MKCSKCAYRKKCLFAPIEVEPGVFFTSWADEKWVAGCSNYVKVEE